MDGDRIRVRDTEPLRRRRSAVLFRILLVVPHYLVLTVWTLPAALLVPIGWVTALVVGWVPRWIHRFLAAYLRYLGQATAWFDLLSGRYPDPLHTREHPFAIEVPERGRQRRLVTLFRAVLAVPAVVLASVFNVILGASSIGAWFVALALGRTTAGLQELGTFCLRYHLETYAYILLLTSQYPKLEPPPPPAEQLAIPGLG